AQGASPRSDLQPLRWLAGEWQGDGPGGRVEAFWLPPGAGSMAGVLRRIREGKVAGYAPAVISEQDGSLVPRFQRFAAQTAGREAQDSAMARKLVSISDTAVVFDGVRVRRAGESVTLELDRPGERPDQVPLSRVVRRRPAVPPASADGPPVLQATPGADLPA